MKDVTITAATFSLTSWLMGLDWGAIIAPIITGVFTLAIAYLGYRKERAQTVKDVTEAKAEVKKELTGELKGAEYTLLREVSELRGELKYSMQMWNNCEDRAARMNERITVLEERIKSLGGELTNSKW